MSWWNDYVGLPYAEKGRDRAGLDCWGLVRLVHAEQFDNQLPSLVDDYDTVADRDHLREIVARETEGWAAVDLPQSGDVAVFRILGAPSHVGIITQPGYFLHVRSGHSAVIERLDSAAWRDRLQGVFRYCAQNTGVIVSAAPHPLKTERLDAIMPSGMTVLQMLEEIRRQRGVPDLLPLEAVVWVDGKAIGRDLWPHYVPKAGARLEMRAVAQGGNMGRTLLVLAVAVAAWYAAPMIMGYAAGSAGWTAAAAAGSMGSVAIASAGLNIAGTLLVNAIFPVRLPTQSNPGTPESQLFLQGGQNKAEQYGAVPVVLGKFRFTPPLGAIAYSEIQSTKVYLHMPLVWGYGPLQVTDLRIGDTPVERLEEVEYETLTGTAGEDKSKFNALYGKDVAQTQPNLLLQCVKRSISSASRASNVVTVVTSTEHGYSVNASVTLSNTSTINEGRIYEQTITETVASGTITEIVNSTTFKFASTGSNGTLAATDALASSWSEHVFADAADKITVSLHFPEGLRQMATEGGNAGKPRATAAKFIVQVRQLDSSTLAPVTSWGDIDKQLVGQTVNLNPAWYNTDSDEALEPVYRWTRLSVDAYGKLIVRHGAVSASATSGPSGTLLSRLQDDNFGLAVTFDRLPSYGAGEEGLWDICVLGDAVVSTVDRRDTSITGGALSVSGLAATVADATIARAETETVRLGGEGQPYYKRKDAFTYNVTFNVPRGAHEVRVRRADDSSADFTYPSGNKGKRFHACYLQAITTFSNVRPIQPPSPLAMTALRIMATNQLNGSIDGISGTVQSICPDWDSATSSWISRATRNPASLFRYVLQHPANAKRVADSKIDLAALADWHAYCKSNKFMFDAVVTQQRSLWDVLSDIAAAGRASPTIIDGKWTVVIDRPRTTVAQHFTPHNSWGFEGVRALPKFPHAFRVQFNNAAKGYQADERIVYNDGYSAANATLFEGLSLPGVTSSDISFKQARFHLAQLKLRPETYTLNVDIEHLVCNRGDLVRVTHDIPLWGLGSGRIRERVSATVLALDEAVPMDAGVQYTIRIRLEDGSSITRTIEAATADGFYSTVTLTASVTTTQAAAGNLFMFGSLASESVECIVQSIEPSENLTARITLVDYSPAIYDADGEAIPDFDSQITQPPKLLQTKITQQPTITQLRSDEGVMQLLPSGGYDYGLRVAFRNPASLPDNVTGVQAEIDYSNDGAEQWGGQKAAPIADKSVTFMGLDEGESYRVRLRYVDDLGRFGPWVSTDATTIVGKSTPPSTPTGLAASVTGTQLALSWSANPEIDVVGYEIRTTDTGWGGSGYLFNGDATSCTVTPPAAGSSQTFYLRAIDAAGLYSLVAASLSYGASAVPNVSAISAAFADTSLTNATVTLDWADVAPAFGLKGYSVSYGNVTKSVSASTITLPADWIGSRSFTVKTIDQRGNVSSGTTTTVSKLAPNPVTNLRAQIIDNNVLLYWDLPAKTSLPIQHVKIKKGAAWSSASLIGTKDGGFTTLQELVAGTYTYWVAVIDTDGYESTPVSVTAQVSQPPDFVFFAQYNSTFSGTYSSSIKDDGVLLPVNTTETWQGHFTARSWTTPQDQINAGFPIFVQPSGGSGYYEETIDYGTTLASSKITVGLSGAVISGSPTVTVTISTSANGTSWTSYPDTTAIYANNFRYFKIRVAVADAAGTGLYKINGLEVTLDAKLKNDAGSITANAGDSGGTAVTFNVPFIDITSLTVTPSGTSALTAVVDFVDAPNPTGFKVLLFNSAGSRASGTVYWSAKGY